MSADFFKNDCVTITKEKYFGLCDDDNKQPAYIDLIEANKKSKWIATIVNNHGKEITVRAIDNCVDIFRDNGDMESRCDIMFTYTDNIVFVELKNKLADWLPGGIDQLESTILTFLQSNEKYYYGFKRKRAFVANRKHMGFQPIENEIMLEFWRHYNIKLDCQATIVV